MKIIVAIVSCLAVVQSAPTTEAPQVPCICTMDYRPVCGVDGITYGNKCGMNCANVELAHDGECGQLCACPRNLEPVCGTDGKTYSNKCLLACAGAALVHEGSCKTERAVMPCICPFIYLPVCGADGVTYGNQCSLDCAKVAKDTDGPCPVAGTTKAPLGIHN